MFFAGGRLQPCNTLFVEVLQLQERLRDSSYTPQNDSQTELLSKEFPDHDSHSVVGLIGCILSAILLSVPTVKCSKFETIKQATIGS